jgi:hypothetical protein
MIAIVKLWIGNEKFNVNTTVATSGAGTTNLSGAPVVTVFD